jgi:hypothetical protein
MLSVETCQKILNGNGKKYTHEEIKKLRDFLYLLGEIDYEQFKESKKRQESSHLHTGFYGGTGREREQPCRSRRSAS